MSSSKRASRDWNPHRTIDGPPMADRERPGKTSRSHASSSTSTSTETTGSAFNQPGYFKSFPAGSSAPRLRRTTPGGLEDHQRHSGLKLERPQLAASLEREEEDRRREEVRQGKKKACRGEEAARGDGIIRPRVAQDWHTLAHRHADVLQTCTYGLALSMGTTTAGFDSLVAGVLPEAAPAGVRTAVLRLGEAIAETGSKLCSQIEAEVAASKDGRGQQEA